MTAACLAIAPAADDELAAVLGRLASADAALLAGRTLLRRCDTKFTLPAAALPVIIAALARDYAVVRMPHEIARYRSLYFDTPDLRCFHDHRRGRRIRHKVRIRQYADRRLGFLEIKSRRNELVTDKQRLAIAYADDHLGDPERAFLRTHLPFADELRPQLWIDYRRITLLNLTVEERVTIDLDLELARLDDTRLPLGTAAVIEVKQAAPTPLSPVMRVLARAGLREASSSKYIAAAARLHPTLRKNRFLPALRALERMS